MAVQLVQQAKHSVITSYSIHYTKLYEGIASPEEAKEFRVSHEAKSQRVLEMPVEELFRVSEVEIEPPEKAIIYPTLICSKCGEGFMEPLGRVKKGEIVCISCFEAKDRITSYNVCYTKLLRVGSKFEIHDKYFTVVGILDYTGSIFDNAVIIPLETAQDLYNVGDSVSYIS